jgi:hypothetical protein
MVGSELVLARATGDASVASFDARMHAADDDLESLLLSGSNRLPSGIPRVSSCWGSCYTKQKISSALNQDQACKGEVTVLRTSLIELAEEFVDDELM